MSTHKINGLEYGSAAKKGWFFRQTKRERQQRGWQIESKLPGDCPLHKIPLENLKAGSCIRWGCDKCLDEAAAFGMQLRYLWAWIHFKKPLPPDMVEHAEAWRRLAHRVKK